MDNINDIIASLTPDDIKSLKETAEAIFGSGDSSFNTSDAKETRTENKSNNFGFGPDINSMLNPEMFSKLAGIMSVMNSDGGKRCKLIEALKPNLSYQRQKKADEAMQILKLLEILPMISNLTNRGD